MLLRLKYACLPIALFCGATFLPSSASAMIVCWVKKTPDGFVALRAQPDANSRMIARMKAGDVVYGGPDDVKEKNGWLYVYWWKKATHHKHSANLDMIDGKGWMRSSLIEEECG